MSFNPQGFHLRRQGKIDSKTKHKMICFKKADSLIGSPKAIFSRLFLTFYLISGRDEEADFQITDIENTQSISRKHFRILFRDNKMFIESIEVSEKKKKKFCAEFLTPCFDVLGKEGDRKRQQT